MMQSTVRCGLYFLIGFFHVLTVSTLPVLPDMANQDAPAVYTNRFLSSLYPVDTSATWGDRDDMTSLLSQLPDGAARQEQETLSLSQATSGIFSSSSSSLIRPEAVNHHQDESAAEFEVRILELLRLKLALRETIKEMGANEDVEKSASIDHAELSRNSVQKRRWGDTVTACIASQCSKLNGKSRIGCIVNVCQRKRRVNKEH